MAIPDTSEVAQRLFEGTPFSFSFNYLSERIIVFINSLFAKVLPRMDQIFLLDTFITILREICINAVKANAKRVYFQKHNIDINDPEGYKKGIAMFKKNIVGKFDEIERYLNKSPYKVIFTLKKEDGGLSVQVVNNSPIHPQELERIRLRKEKAKMYEDFSEAYEEIYDDTEGAGLGIVLVGLLLKNSGIGIDNYRIDTDGKNTRSALLIPFHLKPEAVVTDIYRQIMEEVRILPTFPENIMELQRLCVDPNASIGIISDKIMLDPALSSDLLKLSNSAGFVPGKRIETITDAVKIIGMKNLNGILLATGAWRILDARYSRFEEVWQHCNQTAFYARLLATRFRLSRLVENAFLAALLHDLGKIVMLATDLNLTNRIADIVKDRKIRTSTVLEEISIGLSHATLGEHIARRWGFPDYLIEAIKFHHAPLSASENFRDLVYVVYLANMICGIENRRYQYYYIEGAVLSRFKIEGEDRFNKLHEELKKAFQLHAL